MSEVYDDDDKKTYRKFHMNATNAYYNRTPSRRVEPKLELPSVTLFCADCIHIDYAIPSLERCKALCNFGAVRLLTSMPSDYEHAVVIPPLDTLSAYSTFMLKRAHEYVETTHLLVAQHDGWILNPEAWDPAWLELDYIGPLFIHAHVTGPRSVGSGGFSLRSKRLMEHVSAMTPPWDNTTEGGNAHVRQVGAYEDGHISMTMRSQLEAAGFRFGTPEQAGRFAQGGNNDPAYHVAKPFGFHGLWGNIDHAIGEVSPPPFKG